MADPKHEGKSKVTNALGQRLKKARWRYLLGILHLDDTDKADRYTTLLGMHSMLDRALTALLTSQLSDPNLSAANFMKARALIDRIPIKLRIDLAKAANLISAECAKHCDAVNNVRVNLAHWKSENVEDGWGLGHVKEIASEEASEKCMRRGLRALEELTETCDRIVKSKTKQDTLSPPTVP